MAVVSWIFAALNPESGVRSMLSSEGIRWAFGGLIPQMQSSVLVWLILAGMAWGTKEKYEMTAIYTSTVAMLKRNATRLR